MLVETVSVTGKAVPRFNPIGAHGPDAVGRVLYWHGSAAEFNPKLLAVFPFAGGLRLLLVRLEDPQPPSLGLGVEARQGVSEA